MRWRRRRMPDLQTGTVIMLRGFPCSAGFPSAFTCSAIRLGWPTRSSMDIDMTPTRRAAGLLVRLRLLLCGRTCQAWQEGTQLLDAGEALVLARLCAVERGTTAAGLVQPPKAQCVGLI